MWTFSNAFNTVGRVTIAQQVKQCFTEMSSWFDQCDGHHSWLLVSGRDPIPLSHGVQQGDPLGLLFFALALQPALKSTSATGNVMVVAFLDDVFILGKRKEVMASFDCFVHESGLMGLQCNRCKCWSTEAQCHDIPCKSNPHILGAHLDAFELLPKALALTELVKWMVTLPDPQVVLLLLCDAHNSKLSIVICMMSLRSMFLVCKKQMGNSQCCLMVLLGKACSMIPDKKWAQALLP